MSNALWSAEAKFYKGLRRNPISAKILSEENAAARRLLARLDFSHIHRALDVGVGAGNALSLLERRVMQISAVDSSAEMLAEANAQFPNVTFLCADALALPFSDESFELILCVGVSEYVKDVSLLLKELHRALAPSGVLLFTSASTSPMNWLRYALGHRLFLRGALDGDVAQSGFEMIATSKTLLQIQYLLRKS